MRGRHHTLARVIHVESMLKGLTLTADRSSLVGFGYFPKARYLILGCARLVKTVEKCTPRADFVRQHAKREAVVHRTCHRKPLHRALQADIYTNQDAHPGKGLYQTSTDRMTSCRDAIPTRLPSLNARYLGQSSQVFSSKRRRAAREGWQTTAVALAVSYN